MRVIHATLGAFALIFVANQASGTLMLGSLLMALKGGLFASKMGIGGLLAMALAGTQNQQSGIGGNLASLTTTTYGAPHKRSTRSVQTAAEMPLPINVTDPESESKVLEKIASNLNDVSSPVTRRMMRQIAILDQLSCLPKFICGMNTKTPSKKTSAINDYGFLIKYLFERDDDDAEQDDEEDDEEGDDDVSRTDNVDLTFKTKNQAKKHPLSEDEEDSSDEDVQQDPEALNEEEDAQLEHEAEEELLRTEPEMMMYAMAEDQYKKQRIPGINKNYGVDHAGLSGYNKEDYWYRKNPLLNTDSATQILKEKTRLPPSPYRNKEWDDLDLKEERPGLFSTILPAFISFKRKKISLTKGNSGEDDPFANDPFFDGFRRKKSLPSKSNEAEDIREEFVMQRRNSRFANPLSFFQRTREQLKNATDPLKKYEIAEDFGRQTKNSRQCRMLFARCPYTYNEITGMIDNVKKLVSAQATVGGNTVSLKKTEQKEADASSGGQTSKYSSHGFNKGGIPGGTTQISHELDNGDKVEIMFKIRPKGGNKGVQSLYLPPSEDPELIKANKTIQDMRKALQAIATLHNQTDLEALKEKTEQSIAEILKETLQEKAQTAQPAVDISSTTAASVPTSAPPVIRIPVTKIRPENSQAVQEDDTESDEEDDDDDEDDDDEDANDSLPGPVGPPPPPPADEGHVHFYRQNAEGIKGTKGAKITASKSRQSTGKDGASNKSSPTFESVKPESSQQNDEEEITISPNLELLPKPKKNRPSTRVKPPAALPPLPSPYKIMKKKSGNKSQEDAYDTAHD